MRHANAKLATGLLICVFPWLAIVAQAHVVSAEELRDIVLAASNKRVQDRENLRQILSTQNAEEIIRSKGFDRQQVLAAISLLSDQELADLAARAAASHDDFAAAGIGSDAKLILFIAVAIFAAFIIYASIRAAGHI